jgi:hypothetical protein
VPDDRLSDLGEGRSAADRFAELDARDAAAEGAPPPRDPRRYAQRYTWLVGVAALIVIVAATISSRSDPQVGTGLEPGSRLPDFAAPTAASGSSADANVRSARAGTSAAGGQPACEVEGPDVVNICELRRRPLVVTFVADGCERQLDVVEQVRGRFDGVDFVGVISSQDDAGRARELARPGRWGFPVAADNDAAVFSLYQAHDCPTTVLAGAGGRVAGTRLGPLEEPELAAAVAELERRPDGD